MARRKPITQRFRGHWILRSSIWEPKKYKGKLDYFRLDAEYRLPPRVGRFLQCLVLYWNFLDEEVVDQLEKIGKVLEKRNADMRTVEEVMKT